MTNRPVQGTMKAASPHKVRDSSIGSRPQNHTGDCAFMVRADVRPAFASLGWKCVDDVLHSKLPVVMRRVASRDNCWIDLTADPTQAPMRCYLKRHRESHFFRWLLSRVLGSRLDSAGQAEADGVAACRAANVPSMELVASGWRIGDRPWKLESFFMSEKLPGEPADDQWNKRCKSAEESNYRFRRQSTLEALARTAKSFHEAGLCHRDFYWCHFFVDDRENVPIARLIDLQRLLKAPILGVRWRLKDLGQFVFSMPTDLTSAERRYWFSCYCGRERWSTLDRFSWFAIRVRAWFYGLRERIR